MVLVMTERECKVCKIRLTEYEVEYKDQLCMDCYKEDKQLEETKENK